MFINTIQINTSILNNKLSQNEIYAICNKPALVMLETEKAYKLQWSTEYGTVRMWCPKSCIKTADQINADVKERRSRYENLINFAKENRIKGARSGMKVVTIMQKIKEAGLDYNY